MNRRRRQEEVIDLRPGRISLPNDFCEELIRTEQTDHQTNRRAALMANPGNRLFDGNARGLCGCIEGRPGFV